VSGTIRLRAFILALRVAPETTRRWRERQYRRRGMVSFAVWFGWREDGSSWTSVVPPADVRVLGPFARWPADGPFVVDD
jgi:hypothetical protein